MKKVLPLVLTIGAVGVIPQAVNANRIMDLEQCKPKLVKVKRAEGEVEQLVEIEHCTVTNNSARNIRLSHLASLVASSAVWRSHKPASTITPASSETTLQKLVEPCDESVGNPINFPG